MNRRRKSIKKQAGEPDPQNEPFLFDLPEPTIPEPLVKLIPYPIWTENKAKLIERYLFYFVLITKHGCYIDGFAGPQQQDRPETWAANLVLELEPKLLRHFHLFEKNRLKADLLEGLKQKHAGRDIEVHFGDFNENILKLLDQGIIGQREATFCLLDQQTFECHWRSLEALSKYKITGHKIELFYFFANAWLDRALSAQRDERVLENWWGDNGWRCLRGTDHQRRVEIVVTRLKQCLGYRSVKPWPIFEKKDGGRVMYYMIHMTDHNEAPSLMRRAYDKALQPKETVEQLRLEFHIDQSSDLG